MSDSNDHEISVQSYLMCTPKVLQVAQNIEGSPKRKMPDEIQPKPKSDSNSKGYRQK